ncbi:MULTISPECIES: CidA/LrgA family protein [Aliagarivorans]|uniref:CidA/LrgA family protein n=1 Tax=Aliagarivorans TaxID=882379 RepID=UPI00041CB3A3|nr:MULTISPECIES: CidA/LrgA family protein [Aliagarivorans]
MRLVTTALQYLRGFALLFGFLSLARLIAPLVGDVLPDSILGMLLLLAALQFKIVPLHWVQLSANLLVRWMALLFVPIGVGLIDQLELLQAALPAIIVCCIFATLALLPLVGRVYQGWEQRK